MSASPEDIIQTRIRQVRAYMKDFPEYNRLLAREESTEEQIRLALDLTVNDFQNSPPVVGTFAIETFPSMELLIMGSIVHLLQMEGLLQSRNRSTYNVAGVTFNVSDRTPEYQNWIANLKTMYEQKKTELKRFLNADDCYSGLPSEYGGLDLWY